VSLLYLVKYLAQIFGAFLANGGQWLIFSALPSISLYISVNDGVPVQETFFIAHLVPVCFLFF